MIWHIVKKDIRLLWPLIIASAALRLLGSFVDQAWLRDKMFAELGNVTRAAQIVGVIGAAQIISVMLLIILAVHQDKIPGTDQDWLVRPISRRDLLLAKLLFVVITVQVPWMLASLTANVARHVPIHVTLSLFGALRSFFSLSLPVMIVASLTKSLRQAVTILVLSFAVNLATIIASSEFLRASTSNAATLLLHSEHQEMLSIVFVLVAAAAILPLQYFWRRTKLASAILGLLFVAYIAVQFPPWPFGFKF